MSKSFTLRIPVPDSRNTVAADLIMSGRGRTQYHKDKRRSKKAKAKAKREALLPIE